MEEEKKLPKNIRQMAEKEERVRVYLEDYAYTFIRKLNCTGHVRTGNDGWQHRYLLYE